MEPAAGSVVLQWLGHACFLLRLASGFSLLFDPFPAEQVGYKPIAVKADVVLVSHSHFDHNFVRAVQGRPKVIERPGEHKEGPVRILGVRTSHGDRRGENTLFLVEVEGLRIAHCGDLGVLPTAEQVKSIGAVDVLLVPVGGYYTIDAQQAWQLVQMLKPRVVVPMHYGHPQCKIRELAPVERFLEGKASVKRLSTNVLTLAKEKLPKTVEIWVPSAP